MITNKHNHKQNYFGGGNMNEIAGKASGQNKHRNPPILLDFTSMLIILHFSHIWINITGWVGDGGGPFFG